MNPFEEGFIWCERRATTDRDLLMRVVKAQHSLNSEPFRGYDAKKVQVVAHSAETQRVLNEEVEWLVTVWYRFGDYRCFVYPGGDEIQMHSLADMNELVLQPELDVMAAISEALAKPIEAEPEQVEANP